MGPSSTSIFVRDPQVYEPGGKPEYREDGLNDILMPMAVASVMASPFMIAHGARKRGHGFDSYGVNLALASVGVLVSSVLAATVGYYEGREHADDHAPGFTKGRYMEIERVQGLFSLLFVAPVPILSALYAFARKD